MERITTIAISVIVAAMFGSLCIASAVESRSLRVCFNKSVEELSVFAKSEIELYFGKIFSNRIVFTNNNGYADLVIGIPKANSLIDKAVKDKKINLPNDQNSDQGYAIKTIGKQIYIAANTEQGMLYGIYDFLEQYGVYFQATGEILPEKLDFKIKQIDICKSPVFKYRGILPWANFLCGISGYDIDDYKIMFDRLTRMKFNFV